MAVSIYTLSFSAIPHTEIELYNPITHTTEIYTVPADGKVVFYAGQTSLPVSQRLSKHRTYIKKIAYGDKDKVFPVYEFCAANDIDPYCIQINVLATFKTKQPSKERLFIQAYANTYPMMNVFHTPEAAKRIATGRELFAM